MADEAARLGAENSNNTLEIVNTPISKSQAKHMIDEAIRAEWKKMKQLDTLQTYKTLLQWPGEK